jgi:hypothetical protein
MPRTSAIHNRGPAQVHTIDNDVILLRLVDLKKLGPGITDMLRNTALRPGEIEGDMPWFLDGYVTVDQPRDMQMSLALVEATKGFAIARTDSGEILATFERNELVRASDIADRARAEIAVNILTSESDEDVEPEAEVTAEPSAE